MKIIPIRAFKDNYIWMFINSSSQKAWVVDPGDAMPVIEALAQHQCDLAGILITHHHYDHSGGVAELVKHWKNIPVFGSHVSQIEQITHYLQENDEVDCDPLQFRILEIPGHTLDHIAYYNDKIVFCGDTLFSAGCGRVFEGTPALMYESLSKLYRLPDDIEIYCAHEYTLANLAFAQRVEPKNQFILEKIAKVKTILARDESSLPSVLHEEKQMNPFLRCHEPDVLEAAEHYAQRALNDPIEVFATLRQWKNSL